MLLVKIKEHSWRAKMAARMLKGYSAAIVFGDTIYLWNATRQEFLRNISWVRHEVAHVHQYGQLGMLRFLLHYLWESIRKGYYLNRFEVEARGKESDTSILNNVSFN